MSETIELNNKENVDANKVRADFEEFVNEFHNESDRAAVILGASKLDQLLAMLLEKHFLPYPNNSDPLFSNNGPLGTFSSKIDLSYRLGLIDAPLSKSIHLIRRIRNEFAHEVYGAKLSSGSHKDRVRSLIQPIKDHGWFSFFKDNYFKGVDETRACFSSALGLIIVRLDTQINRVKSVDASNARRILPIET